MTKAQEGHGQRELTPWEALKDLGWFFGLFSAVVGAPSVLSILQHVFVEHKLDKAFQWIVDGYNDLMAVLGAVAEPWFLPAISWLGGLLRLDLELVPVWRPLFALAMVAVGGFARNTWKRGQFRASILVLLIGGFAALIGAIGAGVAISMGGWLAQSLAAAIPVTMVWAAIFLADALDNFAAGDTHFAISALEQAASWVPVASIALGAVGGALSFIPGAADVGGLLALSGGLFVLGASMTWEGLMRYRNLWWTGSDPFTARIGLTILGGFVGAGLILLADTAVKALGGT